MKTPTMSNSDNKGEIRNKVFKYLARREHSKKELYDKLKRKKYDLNAINEVLEDMSAKDYINDERFARIWIEQRLNNKPRGPYLIKKELNKKGVSTETQEKLLAELLPLAEEKRLAKKLAREWLNKKNLAKFEEEVKIKEKLFRYLVQKGFHRSISKEVALDIKLP